VRKRKGGGPKNTVLLIIEVTEILINTLRLCLTLII
jgi:hypothetical protein